MRPTAQQNHARKVTLSPILLAGLFAVRVQSAGAQPAAVATIGNDPVSSAKLEELVGNQLLRFRTEEYQVQRRILDSYIAEELLRRETEARKITFKELFRSEIEAKVSPVTPEEAKAVYESGAGPSTSLAEPEALREITARLQQQRIRRRRAEFVRELRKSANVKVFLEPPRLSVDASGGQSKGPAAAPVTIVEFTDFECPYCARLNPTLAKVRDSYGDRVRLVFRDFPLPGHSNAQKAAEAAACAGDQKKFWEMHDLLFANSQHLRVSELKKYALQAGIRDAEEFGRCLDSGRYAAAIDQSRAAGDRYGVGVTPTLFINGRMLTGAVPYEMLADTIDEELAHVAEQANGGGSH
ncbi:MAG TPA: thioredoxin domain-containing protein [Thermoanaerobaculia bacterium]|nr:thioredoxin domain-containing protein [Thermoanaerobaculia bacterium]